jgi:NitT/TauT family transport system permease protein
MAMSVTPRIQVAGVAARGVPWLVWSVPRKTLVASGRAALRGVSLVLFLIGWHLATTYQLDFYVRFQNIPTPARVATAALTLFASRAFWIHIGASLERIYVGFALATVLGVGLGLLIGWFRVAEDLLFPPIELLRPIPAVAWVPISIMLWPTERASIVFITGLGAFFPIVLNTIHGVEAIDRGLVRAAMSLGAGRASIFREVVIPGAMPNIVTGLSVGMGVSWICLISAEMISGQYGVGYFTWVAYGIVKYPAIVVGMLTIGILGMISSSLIRVFGSWLMPWRPRSAKEEA